MTDYSELVSKARAWSGRGEVVGIAHELADAVEKLVAENADLREDEQEALEERNVALKQRNVLQEQLARVRGLIRDRTWAESLSRDVNGMPFPQYVDMDDLRRILNPEVG